MKKRLFPLATMICCLACSDHLTEVLQEVCDTPSAQGCEWRGQIAQGDQIEIKGIIGDVEAFYTPGTEVVVTWSKRSVHSDPAGVTIEVVSHAGGVTICAVYPDVAGMPHNECGPGLSGNNTVHDNDVEVTFTVRVPEGVTFTGQTISGSVIADGLESDAFVSTVTGDARVSTSGLATATTVTGSVVASIGMGDWDRDLLFATVTGSVLVEIPPNTNANVYAAAVTGSVQSDFPLIRDWSGALHGSIGSGGPRLSVTTVTGSVSLRRGP